TRSSRRAAMSLSVSVSARWSTGTTRPSGMATARPVLIPVFPRRPPPFPAGGDVLERERVGAMEHGDHQAVRDGHGEADVDLRIAEDAAVLPGRVRRRVLAVG